MKKPIEPDKPIRKLNDNIRATEIDILDSNNSEFINTLENSEKYTIYEYIKFSDLINKLPKNINLNNAYLLVKYYNGKYDPTFKSLNFIIEQQGSFNDSLYEAELKVYEKQMKIFHQKMKKFKELEKKEQIKRSEKNLEKAKRKLEKLKNE